MTGEITTYWFGGLVKSDMHGMFKEKDLLKPRWITKEQANRIEEVLKDQ